MDRNCREQKTPLSGSEAAWGQSGACRQRIHLEWFGFLEEKGQFHHILSIPNKPKYSVWLRRKEEVLSRIPMPPCLECPVSLVCDDPFSSLKMLLLASEHRQTWFVMFGDSRLFL